NKLEFHIFLNREYQNDTAIFKMTFQNEGFLIEASRIPLEMAQVLETSIVERFGPVLVELVMQALKTEAKKHAKEYNTDSLMIDYLKRTYYDYKYLKEDRVKYYLQ